MHAYGLEYVRDNTLLFFFLSFLYHLSFVLIYLRGVYLYTLYMFLCLLTLHNQRERIQGHCNYDHYYHKNNSLCTFAHQKDPSNWIYFLLQMMDSPSVMVDVVWFPCCRNMVLFSGLSRLTLSHLFSVPSTLLSLSLSLSDYLTNITTTSREMMVIGHFGLGQLLTWKRKWLQLGVLSSNLFNSFPP